MGWLPGWLASPGDSTAVNNLDPDLRDFLKKGSQRPEPKSSDAQVTSNSKADAQAQASSYWGQANAQPPNSSSDTPSSHLGPTAPNTSHPQAPPGSLYPDGRYAYLWKTYVPPSDSLSSASSSTSSTGPAPQLSDHDILANLTSSVRDAQAAVSKTAAENCIEETIEKSDCMNHGGWHARLTLCREENRKLIRCTEMQARFLRALGYQSLYTRLGRGESVTLPGDETVITVKAKNDVETEIEVEPGWDAKRNQEPLVRMQMHADRLFREMLEKEKSLAAKEDADTTTQAPEQPIMDRERVKAFWPAGNEKSLDELMAPLKPTAKARVQERLDKYQGEERALEERVIEAELRDTWDREAQTKMAFREEKRARLERQRTGTQTFGDRLKWLGGWSQEPDED